MKQRRKKLSLKQKMQMMMTMMRIWMMKRPQKRYDGYGSFKLGTVFEFHLNLFLEPR